MRTKSERVLAILKENPDKVFSRKSLKETFNRLYADRMTDGSINKIMETFVKKNCLRTPTWTTDGYLYTHTDAALLKEAYKEYLLPYPLDNKQKLLALMQRRELDVLPESPSNVKDAVFLSLLIGFGIGDGHLPSKNNQLRFFFFLRRDAGAFSEHIKQHFGIFPIVHHNANCFRATFSDRRLHTSLSSLGLPIGNKVFASFLVPQWIYHGEREVKRAFLQGIFGAEGSRPFQGKYRIQFVLSKNAEHLKNLLVFVNQLRTMLKHFNIPTTQLQVRKQSGRQFHARFYITGKTNVTRFCKEIGFAYASEKQEALEKLIAGFK